MVYVQGQLVSIWQDLSQSELGLNQQLSEFYDTLLSTWHTQVQWSSQVRHAAAPRWNSGTGWWLTLNRVLLNRSRCLRTHTKWWRFCWSRPWGPWFHPSLCAWAQPWSGRPRSSAWRPCWSSTKPHPPSGTAWRPLCFHTRVCTWRKSSVPFNFPHLLTLQTQTLVCFILYHVEKK